MTISHHSRTAKPDAQAYQRAGAGKLLHALKKVEAEGVRTTSLVEDLLLLARLDASGCSRMTRWI